MIPWSPYLFIGLIIWIKTKPANRNKLGLRRFLIAKPIESYSQQATAANLFPYDTMSMVTYPYEPIFLEWSPRINHGYYRSFIRLGALCQAENEQKLSYWRNSTQVQAIFAQISPSEVNVNRCFYSEEQIRDANSGMADILIQSGSGGNFFTGSHYAPKRERLAFWVNSTTAGWFNRRSALIR